MTLHVTMLFSTEPKNVGFISTMLLWFCFGGWVLCCYYFFFLNWFSVFIGFVWKKRLIILTDFINNCLLFYLTVYAFSQTVTMSVIMIMTGLYCELENIGVGILISIQVYYYINHIEINVLPFIGNITNLSVQKY